MTNEKKIIANTPAKIFVGGQYFKVAELTIEQTADIEAFSYSAPMRKAQAFIRVNEDLTETQQNNIIEKAISDCNKLEIEDKAEITLRAQKHNIIVSMADGEEKEKAWKKFKDEEAEKLSKTVLEFLEDFAYGIWVHTKKHHPDNSWVKFKQLITVNNIQSIIKQLELAKSGLTAPQLEKKKKRKKKKK